MTERLRVVLDTNVFVAAYYHPAGASARILRRCGEDGDLELCWTPSVRREILGVLDRVGTSVSYQRRIERLLDGSHRVAVAPLVEVIQEDPSDNKFLACALGGKAHYLVTSDHHLLDVDQLDGTRVLRPAHFLKEIEEEVLAPARAYGRK